MNPIKLFLFFVMALGISGVASACEEAELFPGVREIADEMRKESVSYEQGLELELAKLIADATYSLDQHDQSTSSSRVSDLVEKELKARYRIPELNVPKFVLDVMCPTIGLSILPKAQRYEDLTAMLKQAESAFNQGGSVGMARTKAIEKYLQEKAARSE